MKSVEKFVGPRKELLRKSEVENVIEKEKYDFDEIDSKRVNYVMYNAFKRKLKVRYLSFFGPVLRTTEQTKLVLFLSLL